MSTRRHKQSSCTLSLSVLVKRFTSEEESSLKKSKARCTNVWDLFSVPLLDNSFKSKANSCVTTSDSSRLNERPALYVSVGEGSREPWRKNNIKNPQIRPSATLCFVQQFSFVSHSAGMWMCFRSIWISRRRPITVTLSISVSSTVLTQLPQDGELPWFNHLLTLTVWWSHTMRGGDGSSAHVPVTLQ